MSEEHASVSQIELDDAIALHNIWLADTNTERRCQFAGRDLSGLRFGEIGGDTVNLSGADFTQADLTNTEADDILVDHCSFNEATFDDCQWRQPVFAYSDMRRVSARRATWGTRDPRKSFFSSRADLSHTVFGDADLTNANICGYFFGANLRGARLVEANLSHSNFTGPMRCELTFAGTNLKASKLTDCLISCVSFFGADLSDTDFSRFSDVIMKGCKLARARLEEATFDQRDISSAQMYRRTTRARRA